MKTLDVAVAWLAAICLGLIILAVATACATPAPVIVQTDRPLRDGELEQVRRDVNAALPPDCVAYDIAVKGDQASFTYACMAH